MKRNGFSGIDLTTLQQQLISWRERQSPHTRLPEEVWAAAATLAQRQGVSAVARTLRLDYYKLKRRVAQARGTSPVAAESPRFMELQLPDWPSGTFSSCRAELLGPDGAKLTLHLPGDSGVVIALAQAFWERGR